MDGPLRTAVTVVIEIAIVGAIVWWLGPPLGRWIGEQSIAPSVQPAAR